MTTAVGGLDDSGVHIGRVSHFVTAVFFCFLFLLPVWRGCVDCVVLAVQMLIAYKSSESNDEFGMKLLSKCRYGSCANTGIGISDGI